MNIITNNCVGGQLYRIYDTNYKNPFIWSRVGLDDFIYLVENYNEIDFSNAQYKLMNDAFNGILIDDAIDVLYIHYIYDERYTTPYKNGPDVFYKNIVEYTVNKYFERIQRMDNNPLFIYTQQDGDSKEKLKHLLDLGCIVISAYKINHANHIYRRNAKTEDTLKLAKLLIKKNIIQQKVE